MEYQCSFLSPGPLRISAQAPSLVPEWEICRYWPQSQHVQAGRVTGNRDSPVMGGPPAWAKDCSRVGEAVARLAELPVR